MRTEKLTKISRKKSLSLRSLILPTKFALLFVILTFSSCGNLPKKPSIDLCVHDQGRFKVYCNNNQTGEESTLDINDTDKYLMLSPEDWALVLKYIGKLERRVPKKVRKELVKIKRSYAKLPL